MIASCSRPSRSKLPEVLRSKLCCTGLASQRPDHRLTPVPVAGSGLPPAAYPITSSYSLRDWLKVSLAFQRSVSCCSSEAKPDTKWRLEYAQEAPALSERDQSAREPSWLYRGKPLRAWSSISKSWESMPTVNRVSGVRSAWMTP
ncbi:hypothetical protein D3C85_973830 [compost metagenome]